MPTAKALQDKRREARHKQAVYDLLVSITEPPFGLHAADSAERPLSDLWSVTSPPSTHAAYGQGRDGQPMTVNWSQMPASCDPVPLLDNNQNTIRKKGMPIDQQGGKLDRSIDEIAMLEFMPAASSAPTEGSEKRTNASASRGQQKRWQVESFACVLSVLLGSANGAASTVSGRVCEQPVEQGSRPVHVVDFGCGTGGLLLPLAHLFPHCHFTGVEMKLPALKILEQRAALGGLSNVTAYHGMIEQYEGPVDVALALHACGNATDQVLLLAEQRRAAVIVCPCCVGKLKFSLTGGSSFSPKLTVWHGVEEATNGNDPRAVPPTSLPTSTQPPTASHRPCGAASAASVLPLETAGQDRRTSPCGQLLVMDRPCVADKANTSRLSLTHPRSKALQKLFPDSERTFALMASIADFNAPHRQQTTASGFSGAGKQPPDNGKQLSCNGAPVAPPRGPVLGVIDDSSRSRSASAACSSSAPNASADDQMSCEHEADSASSLGARVHGALRGCVGDAGFRISETHTRALQSVSPPSSLGPSASATVHGTRSASREPAGSENGAGCEGLESSDAGADPGAVSGQSGAAACLAPDSGAVALHCTTAAPHAATRVSGVLSVSLEELGSLCKLHVELDRREALREAGFHSALFRVINAGETAKGDMLVGVPSEKPLWRHCHVLLT